MTDLPALSPAERIDLEREAGYPFVSDEHAHAYRLRRIKRMAVEHMLQNAKERSEYRPVPDRRA